MGNHAEYSTPGELDAFEKYLNSGGALIVLGGDAFGRRVDYIKDEKGRIRYQKLFRNTILGHGVKADAAGRYKWATYPDSAQYSNDQRLARFGLCFRASPGMLDKVALTVEDTNHPITNIYRSREIISESRWESDRVNPDWRVLVSMENQNHDGKTTPERHPALALHPRWKLCYLGPMGLNETLAGYYGDKAKVYELLSSVLEYFLDETR